MSKFERQMNKFWMNYSRSSQKVRKFENDPSGFIEDQLNILESVSRKLTEIRSSPKQISNDDLLQDHMNRLRDAMDSRTSKILSKSTPGSPTLNQTKLRSKIKAAALGNPISKSVYRHYEQNPNILAGFDASEVNMLLKDVKSGEGASVEFKKSATQIEAICRTLVSFCNSSGGCVYVGVAEERDVKPQDNAIFLKDKYWVVGVFADMDLHRQKLTSFMNQHTNLTAEEYSISLFHFKSKPILKIRTKTTFKKSRQLFFLDDEAFMRNDNATYKLKGKQIYEITKKL